jgi:hypothetical protein
MLEKLLDGENLPLLKFLEEDRVVEIEGKYFAKDNDNPYLTEQPKVFFTLRMEDGKTGKKRGYIVYYPTKKGQGLIYSTTAGRSSYDLFTKTCMQILNLLRDKSDDIVPSPRFYEDDYERLEKYKAGVLLWQERLKRVNETWQESYHYISDKMSEINALMDTLVSLSDQNSQVADYLGKFYTYQRSIESNDFDAFQKGARNFIRETLILKQRLDNRDPGLSDFADMDFNLLFPESMFIAYVKLVEMPEFIHYPFYTIYGVLKDIFKESIPEFYRLCKIYQAFKAENFDIGLQFWKIYQSQGDWQLAARILWQELKDRTDSSEMLELVENRILMRSLFKQLGILFQKGDRLGE